MFNSLNEEKEIFCPKMKIRQNFKVNVECDKFSVKSKIISSVMRFDIDFESCFEIPWKGK